MLPSHGTHTLLPLGPHSVRVQRPDSGWRANQFLSSGSVQGVFESSPQRLQGDPEGAVIGCAAGLRQMAAHPSSSPCGIHPPAPASTPTQANCSHDRRANHRGLGRLSRCVALPLLTSAASRSCRSGLAHSRLCCSTNPARVGCSHQPGGEMSGTGSSAQRGTSAGRYVKPCACTTPGPEKFCSRPAMDFPEDRSRKARTVTTPVVGWPCRQHSLAHRGDFLRWKSNRDANDCG